MSTKNSSPAAIWRSIPDRYTETRSARLITWSTIHAAPQGYDQFAPYTVAVIEYDDKTRGCVQLTDVAESDLVYGLRLRPVFRKMYIPDPAGVIPYGTKYTI